LNRDKEERSEYRNLDFRREAWTRDIGIISIYMGFKVIRKDEK
jgi:hypothetical protein